MTFGVMGCLTELPPTFPLETPENSGNVIHANAPFEMFSPCFHARDPRFRVTGSATFAEFVNRNCSHLIVTLANTLRLGQEDGSPFERLHDFLRSIDKPIVVFGLGVQAVSDDIAGASLPQGAVDLMRFLGRRCATVGVRGETTATILRQLCGVENVHVTGCPSVFSRPSGLADLERNLAAPVGRPAFSATKYHEPGERHLLHQAIRGGAYLVEPVNRFNHRFYVEVSQGRPDAEVPYFLRSYRPVRYADPNAELREHFASRYRLFRQPAPWYEFNRESVAFTYGTRFHVNMASILSGKPALWLTHDARTRELADFLHLPSIAADDARELEPGDIHSVIDYGDFLANIGGLFDNFNEYLAINGMPETASFSA
jgi:hypothetical protein